MVQTEKEMGMGAALWLKENYLSLLGIVREFPKILLSLLLLFLSLPTAMSILIIPEDIYVKIAYILFFRWTVGLLAKLYALRRRA